MSKVSIALQDYTNKRRTILHLVCLFNNGIVQRIVFRS